MKKHRFLVLPLVLLALLGLGLLVTPRASAHTLQPPPPPQLDGTCTPRIDTTGFLPDNTTKMITIYPNECAQQLIQAGISPDQISTFAVTYQLVVGPTGTMVISWLTLGLDGGGTIAEPVDPGYASTITTIVANQLQNLQADYAACQNTHATLSTWMVGMNGATADGITQQLITNASLQSGCNQPLTPGA